MPKKIYTDLEQSQYDVEYLDNFSNVRIQFHVVDNESGILRLMGAVGRSPCGDFVTLSGNDTWIEIPSTAREFTFDFQDHFVVGDTYYICLKARNGAASDVTRSSNGIVADNTPPTKKEKRVFEIENKNIFKNVNFVSVTDNISLYWKGAFEDSESGIAGYTVSLSSNGEDIIEPIDYEQDRYNVTIYGLDMQHDTKYSMTVNAMNGARLISTVVTNGFRVDITPPDASNALVIDGNDLMDGFYGEDLEFMNGGKIAYGLLTQRFFDSESGIGSFEVSVINDLDIQVGDAAKFNGDATKLFVGLELALEHLGAYKLRVRAYNRAGLYSDIYSNGFIVDSTTPEFTVEPTMFMTGKAGHKYILTLTEEVELNWAAQDPETDIRKCELTVGTFPGGNDVISSVVKTASETFTLNGPWVDGQTMYHSVKCCNYAAGCYKFVATEGLLVDISKPKVGVVIDGLNSNDFDFSPFVTSVMGSWQFCNDGTGSGIKNYDYCLGEAKGSCDVSDWRTTAFEVAYWEGLSLVEGGKYYISVRATDYAGHVSNIRSSDGFIVDSKLYMSQNFRGFNFATC
eukprot:TRINITY_DN12427_c0_g1_i9.p1 TRINITY_DN12427_c0_g1~~TRINITY_DN12427_c0_g1_i9.p1  ORF type:complete len:628 (+),score=233.28 TRINITY_DN12427_c0_g1_i9:177-1886(+)